MRWLRKLLLVLACLGFVVLATAAYYYYNGFYHPKRAVSKHASTRLLSRAVALRQYLHDHHYNENIAFLIDMRISSGKNRFFVYDLKGDSIKLSGLVAHGSCNLNFSVTPNFSNVSGSGCSSLGRYKVGNPYKGQFGTAYKLFGMDSTNDQAYARNVVLHNYDCVPAGETDPMPICNSKGCAMVSPAFLQQLQPVIDRSKKPILLWIFN